MKVFLGGTCAGYKWRDDLIPMLKCDYYNPIVKNWSESDRQREVRERETADYVLYVITSGMKGVYSIAEVIDDSNKRPDKTILCVLYDGIDRQMAHSLKAVVNLARDNGVTVCESLEEVAEVLNSTNNVIYTLEGSLMNKYRITIFDVDKLNDYIVGRISGIVWVLSGMPEIECALMKNRSGNFNHQIFFCTEEQYQTIINTIDKKYGGMVSYKIEEVTDA